MGLIPSRSIYGIKCFRCRRCGERKIKLYYRPEEHGNEHIRIAYAWRDELTSSKPKETQLLLAPPPDYEVIDIGR